MTTPTITETQDSKTEQPDTMSMAGKATQPQLSVQTWRNAPQVSKSQDRCSRLHDKAVSAQRETDRLRRLLKQAAKKSDRLRTVDMSNRRLEKELAAGINAEAHALHGNGELLTTAEVYALESTDAFLTGCRSQLLSVLGRDRVVAVFVPADNGWQEFSYREALDLYEDCDLVDDYLLVLCRRHNRSMHSLHGNTDSKADRAAKRALDASKKQATAAIKTKTPRAPKSAKGTQKLAQGNFKSMAKQMAATKAPQPAKAPQAKAPSSLQSVAAQLADSNAKQQAIADVAKVTPAEQQEFDEEVERAQIRLAADTVATDLGCMSWLDVNGSGQIKFSIVYVSPEAKSDCYWTDLAKILGNVPYLEPKLCVAKNEHSLITPVVAHTVLNVCLQPCSLVYDNLQKLAPPKSGVDDAAFFVKQQLPLLDRLSQCPMKSMLTRCQVEIKHYGFGWPDAPYRTENTTMRINMSDVFTHMSQRLVRGVDFETDLQRVTATLERTDDIVNCNKYDMLTTTVLHDVVHTGLLTILAGPKTVSSGELQYQFVRKVLYDQFCKARPAPEGIYLLGYDVKFKDIFPDIEPEKIDKVLNTTSGFIAASRAGVVSTAKEMKKRLGYAMKSAADIVGLHGSFPRPEGVENIFTGFCKRLAGKLEPRSDDMRKTCTFLGQLLVEEIKKCPAPKPPERAPSSMTGAEMIAEAKKHAATKGWREDSSDYNDFMRGFEAGCGWMRDGTARPGGRDLPDVFLSSEGLPTDYYSAKAFLKPECQPSKDNKCVRFIVAPPVSVRGYTQAILMRACEVYVNALTCYANKHSIKHQTVEQWQQYLIKTFDGRKYYAETDFTSFESNIDSEMLKVEGDVLTAIAPDDDKAQIQAWYAFLCRSPIHAESSLFTFFLDPMRKSGEFQTSIGNNICNLIFIAYIFLPVLCRADGLDKIRFGTKDEAADKDRWRIAFHVWFVTCVFLFEGDDGLIHLGHDLDSWERKWVEDAIKFLAVRLKFTYQTEGCKLNFCGTTVINMGDGSLARVVDTLELLANATTLFDAVRDDSALQASIKAYGKVCSYAVLYKDVPIVSTFCTEAVNFYRRQTLVANALKSIKDEAAALQISPAAYLRTVSAIDGTPPPGVQALDKMFSNAKVIKQTRQLLSELEYFSRNLDDDFVDTLMGGSLVLNMFALPPVDKIVSNAAALFRERVRAALDFEVGGYGANFVASCEKQIHRAFAEAEASGATHVHVDIPEIRAIMRGQRGHDETIEVPLDDARQRAEERARLLIDEHNAYTALGAWKRFLSSMPVGLLKTGATSAPLVALSLVWCGYIGLPVIAVLAALVGIASFIFLLPFNGMSIWKTIPKTMLLMTFVPVLYGAFLLHQSVLAYDRAKRTSRASFQRALLTTDRLNNLLHHALRGKMSLRTAWAVPQGFVWHHVFEIMPSEERVHRVTIGCTPEDFANGVCDAFVEKHDRYEVVRTLEPVPVCSAQAELTILELLGRNPTIPIVTLESGGDRDWLAFRCGDSLEFS